MSHLAAGLMFGHQLWHYLVTVIFNTDTILMSGMGVKGLTLDPCWQWQSCHPRMQHF